MPRSLASLQVPFKCELQKNPVVPAMAGTQTTRVSDSMGGLDSSLRWNDGLLTFLEAP